MKDNVKTEKMSFGEVAQEYLKNMTFKDHIKEIIAPAVVTSLIGACIIYFLFRNLWLTVIPVIGFFVMLGIFRYRMKELFPDEAVKVMKIMNKG